MTESMIRTSDLTKTYSSRSGDVCAVRDLGLDIADGELVALLGPNGAGKSTTLRMLTTLLPPTSGTAYVAGHDVRRDPSEVRRNIGYVGQGNGAAHIQRGRDELLGQGRAYGMSRADTRRRADLLIDGLDLSSFVDRKAQEMSGGQRRRLDIALGMIHAPRLLFLDEPSTGLDPQNRANLQEQVALLHEAHQTTIVLTTHYLDEADALAQRVVVIDHGVVIADDKPEVLKRRIGDSVVLRFADGRTLTERRPNGGEYAAKTVAEAVHTSNPAVSVKVVPASLDDVFLDLTGRSLREDAA
ncbi:MAG: ATP-binding cassette domain-containing protein [Cumulibacter sp.]